VSILITSAAVAGGLAFGRWLSLRVTRREAGRAAMLRSAVPPTEDALPTNPLPTTPPKKIKMDPADDEEMWARFPCRLGDVVVHPGGDEAWLAGATILSEDVAAAILFVAPEAKNDRALYVLPKPSTDVTWLSPVAADAWTPPPTEPPTTIEIEGEPFERVRRLPFRAARIGEGAPELGADVLLAEYKSQRSLEKRVISISGGGHARAWVGTIIDIETCDVLPGGAQTLTSS
jgi:hypothetical protein